MKMILESHGGGFVLKTARKYASQEDRYIRRFCTTIKNENWEPAKPISVLIQSDYEFPTLARALGYEVACCHATDGTVDCPTHGTSSGDMITNASLWLSAHTGILTAKQARLAFAMYDGVLE